MYSARETPRVSRWAFFWRAGLLIALVSRGSAGCAAATAVVETSPEDYAPDPLLHEDGRRIERQPVRVAPVMPGVALPYPVDRIYGTFGDCRPGGRQHRGLDLGGVGPNAGLGTPIRSMVRARILFIGRPEEDPARFGQPDRRPGTVVRRGVRLPRSEFLRGYGEVHYFTRDYGSWRSGAVVVTEGVAPPLLGYRIRYMHMGAIHPELQVGDIVEAGQEIARMGGTAILQDLPHVHIDIETADGVRVDVAPYLGLEADTRRCR